MSSLSQIESPGAATGASSQVLDAYRRAREAILSGELSAGTATSQQALSERLGVSRTPLREALRMLEREGLVENPHHQRLRIAPFSVRDVEELYALRIVNETFALRLTVPRLDAAARERIGAVLLELEALSEARDVANWGRCHRSFHGLLTDRAGTRLTQLVSDLSDHAERYRRFYLDQESISWSSGARDHRRIAEACLAGEGDRAAVELASHLARTALAVILIAAPEHEPRSVRDALRSATRSAQRVSSCSG